MAILRYLLPLLLAILLSGCYETFSPDIVAKPVLCLNSLITAGEPIEVQVTHTWRFNDDRDGKDNTVTDAQVTVYVNDAPVTEDYLPQEGDRIRIEAVSDTYGTAWAEVAVPVAAPIEKVKVTPIVTDMWRGDDEFFHYEMLAVIKFNLNIELDIKDTSFGDNYYRFRYNWDSPSTDDSLDDDEWWYGEPTLTIGQPVYDLEPIFSEHVGAFETAKGNSEDINFVFFTDRQFAGKTYTLHLHFADNLFRITSAEYDESLFDCHLNLYIETISGSYYNWAVYQWNTDEGVLGELSDIGMADSMWAYSNVSTGAGVVAARSTAKYVVELKDFLKDAEFLLLL